MPIITVIMPTYGEPTNLRRAILSVIGQTVSDWELFVVDDNNPGTEFRVQTERIMKDFEGESRINYLKHECNKNGSGARNTGIKHARGKYIAFLDDDDEYVSNRLETCLDILEKNIDDKVAGVYTGCVFYRDGKCYAKKAYAETGNFMKETLAVKFNFYSGSNLFIKKRVVDELNGFDETFIRHQDYEFLVRIFKKYKLIGVPQLLLIKNEIGRNIPDLTKLENVKKQYLKKYSNEITSLKKFEQNDIYYSHWIELAHMAQLQGDDRLKRYFSNAIRYRKLKIVDAIKFLFKR